MKDSEKIKKIQEFLSRLELDLRDCRKILNGEAQEAQEEKLH
jgi:hypothetical protein